VGGVVGKKGKSADWNEWRNSVGRSYIFDVVLLSFCPHRRRYYFEM
jgi:hypothetical protein